MYVTKEVEIWLDPADLEDFFPEELSDIVDLARALEMLHDEHHDGPVSVCFHEACRIARDGLKAARRFAHDHRIEDPSLAALHAYGATIRAAEERARGAAAGSPS